MALVYVAAGINHFIHPEFYLKIMPPWLGWQKALIIISGICESLFGLLLIPHKTRVTAAWCIIALLIAVFPANIQMMLNYLHQNKPGLWIAVVRLPLQFVLIWWAWLFTRSA